MATFLLEIRTEEIPAAALPGARRQLHDRFSAKLAEAGFDETKVEVLSTSLRLAVLVDGLPDRQPDRTEKMTGPPVRVAVAEDGSATPAGEGFARKVGLAFDELGRVETDKGEYLTATVVHEGRAATEILAEMVPSIVAALRFPKMMRWGDGRFQFVRPVHGVVALLDDADRTDRALRQNLGADDRRSPGSLAGRVRDLGSVGLCRGPYAAQRDGGSGGEAK